MKHTPQYLMPNDKVAIVATARKVSAQELTEPIKLLTNWGLQVITAPHLFATENQFAGSPTTRASSMQWALDNDDVKAIFIARGGYGTMQIIDLLDFKKFTKNPKWIVGFSDITVLHSHIQKNLKIKTIHAAMPITFDKDKHSVNYLKQVLFGKLPTYQALNKTKFKNKIGSVKGKLVGGNLSILYALQGSKSDINTNNKILFIEDLDEYLYHVHRMLLSLKRSGKLAKLKALIVGSMIDMKDNQTPFGKTAEQIILELVDEYDYPVVFNFPSGHNTQNFPLIMGSKINLEVTENRCSMVFL